jgi:hypothetical protein
MIGIVGLVCAASLGVVTGILLERLYLKPSYIYDAHGFREQMMAMLARFQNNGPSGSEL